MIDVDQFKEINDRYGHPVGDTVLKEITTTFKRNLRTYDLLARLGGDEFAIILPEAVFQDAYRVAEKIRTATAQLVFPGMQSKTTISVGIACYPLHHVNNVESLLKKADVALYKAKQMGRNTCFFYGQQEMLELFGQVALDGNAPSQMSMADLMERMEVENRTDVSEEIDFIIGKSIDNLKELIEQVNHLKIMAVQMNSQVHQLDPGSNKVVEVNGLLQKLVSRQEELEQVLQDYARMLSDLPLMKNQR